MKKENENLIKKLNDIYNDKPLTEKIEYFLSNIFHHLFKNKLNGENFINEQQGLVKDILNDLKSEGKKDLFETAIKTEVSLSNLNDRTDTEMSYVQMNTSMSFIEGEEKIKTDDTNHLTLEKMKPFSEKEIRKMALDKLINAFANFLRENFSDLLKKDLLKKEDLEKLSETYSSDEKLKDKFDKMLKDLNDYDQEREFGQSLNNMEDEISEIYKMVKNAYKDHCNEINFTGGSQTETNLSDVRQQSIVRRSIRLSVSNIVAKISASSKKTSILTDALNFTMKNSKYSTAISVKENQEIQPTIEKIINNLSKLYKEYKIDSDVSRNSRRKLLIGNLLECLRLLSVSPDNHVQIFELGHLNFMEKVNLDVKNSVDVPVFLQIENLNVAKNCTITESAIPLFISSNNADDLVESIYDIYKNPNKIQEDSYKKEIFRSSNKIFSNLCQDLKGFNYVFDKLGMDKLLEISNNTYDENIIDAILEMIINFINNNPMSEIEKFLMPIVKLVIKSYKVYRNNTEKIELITKAVLIVGLINKEKVLEVMDSFDFVKETCQFDINLLLQNLEFLNSFSFTLGKISFNNPKIGRSCFEEGIINKINEQIENNLLIHKESKDVNFAFLENISNLFKNILKNNLKIVPKFLETNATIKGQNIKQIPITNNLVNIIQKLLDPNIKNESENISIFNNCEALESITMDPNGVKHLANIKFNETMMNLLTEKQGEGDIVKTVLECMDNYFNKEIGKNMDCDFNKILEILKGLQKKHYLSGDILMIINSIANSLYMLLNKDNQADLREGFFKIILESINIQDWNVDLLLNALKMLYEILRKKENRHLLEIVFDDYVNSLFAIISNHQNNFEVITLAYKILSLLADKSVYGYALLNNGLLELIQESFLKLNAKNEEKVSQIDNELKKVLFELLEKLCSEKNSAKKIADALSENLIVEMKNENASSPSSSLESVLKLFRTITSHPNTVESFLQFEGHDLILNFLKCNPMNIENSMLSLNIIENIAKNGNNYKKKLKDCKAIEIITELMNKTKTVSKEINLLGGIIINELNEMDLEELNKVEDVNVIKMNKSNMPIKPKVKNFLTNGKVVRM